MIKKISREDLVRMKNSGEAFKLVDVLSRESYEREHIPGAISIPLEEIEVKAAGILKKEELVVVYCASFECQASTKAAEKLIALGYKNVLDYKGGLKDYKEGGFTMAGGINEGRRCASCCSCD